MLYREVPPIPELAPYVECIWMLRCPAQPHSAPQPVLPDGCTELVIHCGNPFRRFDASGRSELQPRFILAGQMLSPVYLQPTGIADCVGVRFRSEASAFLLGTPVSEFTGEAVDLALLDRDLAGELDTVASASEDQRVELLGYLLLRRLRTARLDPAVSAAVRRIRRQRGLEPVAALCSSVGTSQRELERRFAVHVGLSPKRLARLVRFQSFLRAASTGNATSLVQLALEHGYYDQAHLVHEFRALGGRPPAALLESMESLTRAFCRTSVFYKTA